MLRALVASSLVVFGTGCLIAVDSPDAGSGGGSALGGGAATGGGGATGGGAATGGGDATGGGSAATVPGAPSGVTAQAADASAAVTWTPGPTGGSPIVAWVVTASPGGASVTVAGSATTATLTNLVNGTTYSVTVHGINGAGAGAPSAPVMVTPGRVPAAPGNVQLAVSNAALVVTWAAPTDTGGSAVVSYAATASPGGATVTSSTASATLPGLVNGTAYTVTVVATNAFGTSPPSAPAGPLAPGTVPSAPSAVSAVAGNASALVSWAAPADTGGRPVTGYAVTASPGGALATTTGATSATVSGLTNGTAYTFTVKALNVLGAGPSSGPSSAVTPATTPGAPTAVTATAGQGTITVAWTAPADTGGLPLQQYRVTTLPGGATTLVSGTTTTLTLGSGTSFTFTVAASNALGFGPASSPSSATTTCGCSGVSTCCDGCFPRAVGSACSDGKFCTVSETCQANGTCGGGTAKDCAGLVTVTQCQQPTCDVQLDACAAAAKPDNTACNDSSLCTTTDVCLSGACVGQNPVVCPETDCKLPGTCAPATGLCSAAPKADGLACNGPANTEAQCASGACQASSCVPGFGNCNMASPDCETDLRTDVSSCGLCGQACRTGNRFLHARTRCANAGCVFLGCDPGWQDADSDCTTGAETCNTGCEACQALGDGSFDVPDDGADNDCAGGDSTNTDVLGWYVDSSFTPTGTAACPGSVARGTRACPFTSLYDVTFAASQQSWAAPGPSRRYVYVAQGSYVDVGTVLETSVPLVYAGGYVRTASGPWTRTGAASVITSSTGGAVTGLRLIASAGWAVLDRVSFSQRLEVGGNFLLRGVSASTADVVSVASLPTVRGIVEGTSVRSVNVSAHAGPTPTAPNWVLRTSSIGAGGIVSLQSGWRVETVTLAGPIDPYYGGPVNVTLRDVQSSSGITGGVVRLYSSLISDSSFGGPLLVGYFGGSPGGAMTIRRTQFAGGTLVQANLTGCTVTGDLTTRDLSSIVGTTVSGGALNLLGTTLSRSRVSSPAPIVLWNSTAADSLFLGAVQSTGTDRIWSSTLIGAGTASAVVRTTGLLVLGNSVVHRGAMSAATYGVEETATNADGIAVFNNAFVGFAPTKIYLDEGTTPLADVSRLNTLSQLSACARGGNVAFDTDAQAGLRSSDPASPLVGRITAGPLIDAARPLPTSCDTWSIPASTTDLTGANARVCRTGQDIGAYEVCP